MADCIFCKITAGIIPCQKIYEDNNFLGFLDNKPFTLGHTVVIPKKHFRWVYDVEDIGAYWEVANLIAKTQINNLSPTFVTFLTMGNQVPHAHIHVIPRYKDDKLTGLFSEDLRQHPTEKELNEISTKLKF
jgi:histidine triad (HIT) family protein